MVSSLNGKYANNLPPMEGNATCTIKYMFAVLHPLMCMHIRMRCNVCFAGKLYELNWYYVCLGWQIMVCNHSRTSSEIYAKKLFRITVHIQVPSFNISKWGYKLKNFKRIIFNKNNNRNFNRKKYHIHIKFTRNNYWISTRHLASKILHTFQGLLTQHIFFHRQHNTFA